jgi:putative SOS response-associated peptidase YedK
MCGRLTQSSKTIDYARMLDAVPSMTAKPSYNVAPSQAITICRMNSERTLLQVRWGLIPFWAKDTKTGYSMINARAETVATKPAYRSAFKKRRCLIPTDGFYEWRSMDSGKQPYFIHREDKQPFALAGLWEHWEKEGQVVESCTIIVTSANKILSPIHDRMPVIIDPENFQWWLDPELDGKELSGLLVPHAESGFEAYPINTAVNKPANNDSGLIERIELKVIKK